MFGMWTGNYLLPFLNHKVKKVHKARKVFFERRFDKYLYAIYILYFV